MINFLDIYNIEHFGGFVMEHIYSLKMLKALYVFKHGVRWLFFIAFLDDSPICVLLLKYLVPICNISYENIAPASNIFMGDIWYWIIIFLIIIIIIFC